MVTLEQVEKLRERANISYDEAKKALEETDGDILEAVINLEKQQRIQAPASGGYYHSKEERKQETHSDQEEKSKEKIKNEYKNNFGDLVSGFFKALGKILHIGNINSFEIVKDNKKIMVVPLTVFALLLIFAFWFVIPVLIVGLVFGYRYRFSGPDLEKTQVNRAMDSVSDAAVRAVDSVVDATENFKKESRNKGGNNNGQDRKENGENTDHRG